MNSVSLVPHLALQYAGITDQTTPAAMHTSAITGSSSQPGMLLPHQIMHAADASAPMSTCPSAPVFQNFILNAGVTASAMHSSIAVFCSVSHSLRMEPKLPLIMEA